MDCTAKTGDKEFLTRLQHRVLLLNGLQARDQPRL
jgi:hypothetical protein